MFKGCEVERKDAEAALGGGPGDFTRGLSRDSNYSEASAVPSLASARMGAQGSRGAQVMNPGKHVGNGNGDYKRITSYVHVGHGLGDHDYPDAPWMRELRMLPEQILRYLGLDDANPRNYYLLAGSVAGVGFLLLLLIMLVPRLGSQTGPSLMFSCDTSMYPASQWSLERKAWCCDNEGVACGGAEQTRWKQFTPLPSPRIQGSEGNPNQFHECPGTISVSGYGEVALVNAILNQRSDPAKKVEVNGAVVPHMKGRSYFASSCSASHFDNRQYAKLHLLGKTFSYTADLSAANCGCNAALYLTSLAQNTQVSTCDDYYCDANRVCGVNCPEVDIQEANTHAWFSTLHTAHDGDGKGVGFGNSRHQWNATVYGPGARCIDTSMPFRVSAYFPTDTYGKLKGMQVTLSQPGHSCPLTSFIGNYEPNGEDGMQELTNALAEGMTPVISYWGDGTSMLWMDGEGRDGKGPCDADKPLQCGESVSFYDFSLA